VSSQEYAPHDHVIVTAGREDHSGYVRRERVSIAGGLFDAVTKTVCTSPQSPAPK
jgi:hypothetical protein